MDTIHYLDAVRDKLPTRSDYAVAKALGVSKQAVSRYMKGTGYFDDYVAIRVAELLKIDPLQVIADVNMQRTQNAEVRAVWKGLLEKISEGFKELMRGTAPCGCRLAT
jgi:predicted transcriptional regulator